MLSEFETLIVHLIIVWSFVGLIYCIGSGIQAYLSARRSRNQLSLFANSTAYLNGMMSGIKNMGERNEIFRSKQ